MSGHLRCAVNESIVFTLINNMRVLSVSRIL